MLAISERVVIRANDLLNWCDDTINWTYGLRANTLLDPTIKKEKNEKSDSNLDVAHSESESEANFDGITSTNIRSLKNSKLDFAEVEKEKGKNIISFTAATTTKIVIYSFSLKEEETAKMQNNNKI